jgi:hypothetical protein
MITIILLDSSVKSISAPAATKGGWKRLKHTQKILEFLIKYLLSQMIRNYVQKVKAEEVPYINYSGCHHSRLL